MICCDTCPFIPTCEEVDDFERVILRRHPEWAEKDEWAEEHAEGDDRCPDCPVCAEVGGPHGVPKRGAS